MLHANLRRLILGCPYAAPPYTGLVQLNEARASLYRFGNFELNTENGELRKAGVLVKLPPQPLGVLALLVENAGELVSRDQIQKQVWGDHTFVDFDRNLNVCMTQIRAALNDDAETPRFIRTIPKRGYMFLPPVEKVGAVAQPVSRRKPWPLWVALLVMIVCAVAAYFAWPRAGRPMLAVLPFDGETEVVDGLTEELIDNLGMIHAGRLGVIARSSVMRFKGAGRGVSEIARDLRVQFVVEGTVRRSGQRVRVTVRLVKAADQTLVWTETYEEDAADVFRMEQEAAARITAGITQRLFPQTTPASINPRSAILGRICRIIRCLRIPGAVRQSPRRDVSARGRSRGQSSRPRRNEPRGPHCARKCKLLVRLELGGGGATFQARPRGQPKLCSGPSRLRLAPGRNGPDGGRFDVLANRDRARSFVDAC